MILTFIKMNVRPEKRKELSQTLHSIVEQVRKESGCRHSGVYQNIENQDDFLMVEEWAIPKDSDDHQRSDIFTVLMGAGTLMRRPPEIVIYTVSRSKELET